MLAFVKTAALVVILFLIMALLSRMSAPEVHLEVGVQHSVKKLIQKGQEAASNVSESGNAVHNYVHSTNALSHLDAALSIASVKQCEALTGCKVKDVHTQMIQSQENAAHLLFLLQQQPPRQYQQQQPQKVPVHMNPRHQQNLY